MREYTKEIDKEVYDRAVANNNSITNADEEKIFSTSIRYGYGLYGTRVFEEDGKYMVRYKIGDSCD